MTQRFKFTSFLVWDIVCIGGGLPPILAVSIWVLTPIFWVIFGNFKGFHLGLVGRKGGVRIK